VRLRSILLEGAATNLMNYRNEAQIISDLFVQFVAVPWSDQRLSLSSQAEVVNDAPIPLVFLLHRDHLDCI